ncbi:MAG: glycerol kinase GlpK [Candidatus Hydrogenedentes bacterium]|nr:glycerol kinase GlpK [Candidatus Hydrogenedentota bacterium]
MSKRYILAMDQGTTSSRSVLFDESARIAAVAAEEFEQIYPQPGWVEHDPEAIWNTQLETARRVLREANVRPDEIAAIGVTNQRETTVIWERATGRPIYNAIVWQCRRTTEACERLSAAGLADEVRQRTGLVIDAYFSGTKAVWILDHVPGARARAERGELCFGTIDSWLLYKLTGQHATDVSNASRTLLFNIHGLDWDDVLLGHVGVPRAIMPSVGPSSHVYGTTKVLGADVPVAALCGDQQSALFGQTAFNIGDCKNTYGTGCFLLMNTGANPVESRHGLLTTLAWSVDGKVDYALEGSVFIGGAVIQWLRDELGLIASAEESEALALSVPDSGGVRLVPAFVGLGAPHWDMRARGVITGLTRGANRAHIVRAALESISFQSADVLRCMEADSGQTIRALRVDGGAARNDFLLQHQADVLGIPVLRGRTSESTALGAAFLAGLAVEFWPGRAQLSQLTATERVFEPSWNTNRRESEVNSWHRAVTCARSV